MSSPRKGLRSPLLSLSLLSGLSASLPASAVPSSTPGAADAGIVSVTIPDAGQQTLPSPAPSVALEAWRATMLQTPLPTTGCFHAVHPSVDWEQVPCITVPPKPQPPNPDTVGGGNDFWAGVVGATAMSQAGGAFLAASGVTSEYGAGVANEFALQLNSNLFQTPACRLPPGGLPGCIGWQQFIFSNGNAVYMQYWLIDYGPNCPTGWNYFGNNQCFMNSPGQGVPRENITALPQLWLTGTAQANGSPNDQAIFGSSTGEISAVNTDGVQVLRETGQASSST